MHLHDALEFSDLMTTINEGKDVPEDAEHAPGASLVDWRRRQRAAGRARHFNEISGPSWEDEPCEPVQRLLKVMRGNRIVWRRRGRYTFWLTPAAIRTGKKAAAKLVKEGKEDRGDFVLVLSRVDDSRDLFRLRFKA